MKYFDRSGREFTDEQIALDWAGRNRERAMQAFSTNRPDPRGGRARFAIAPKVVERDGEKVIEVERAEPR